MTPSIRSLVGGGLLVILVTGLLFSLAVPGAAQSDESDVIESNTSATYEGTSGDSQAISVEVSFTARTQIEELRIEIDQTSNTFIDYSSIEPAIQGAGTNITATGQEGVYLVESLEPGQTVTFEFDAYPRQLNQESLSTATVRLSAENPRTLSLTETVEADMSTSPLLQYREAQEELGQSQLFDNVGLVGFGGGILFGLVGLAVGVVMYRRQGQGVSDAYDDAADRIARFKRDNDLDLDPSHKDRLKEVISEIRAMDDERTEPPGAKGTKKKETEGEESPETEGQTGEGFDL